MNFLWVFLLLLLLLPISISADCTCDDSNNDGDVNKSQALKFKLIAVVSILVAGAVGVCVPLLGKMFDSLRPESNGFLTIKFFAAGVILATGFVHVFPDANESLENPCLGEKSWGDFPLANFIAMVSAVVVMMVETAVMSLFNRWHYNNNLAEHGGGDEEKHQNHVHVHTHASNGHAHAASDGSPEGLLRHRILSQVLEVGILIHSVIIGVSLGVSVSPKTIKPLIIALSFHQLFEGMGLGTCITEAKFNIRTIATMSIFFSLTTPIGIAIGFGISNTYDENGQTALIVQGVLNAASAGILIYMALVDLLAADFMKSKVQTSPKLQMMACIALLLGLGCMSLLAKWA
ncbi:zinc transporter 5-like [Cynara cardunculus var. scolymus]|uniref:Zinc/iron permease n=1 Tax=Cynara cardunculus var. scolymus TaxID=59895 RepID=A0A124R899_CYNCS|nr:zinc transporter 5-like [Cynara cardunculus var. scolymus]KVG57606.1 Zinc/iron permease [Cynara cardunculus var. scolymus]